MSIEYTGLICPHCNYETGIDPALVEPDAPMLYCTNCDEPLFPEGIGGQPEFYGMDWSIDLDD